MAMPVTPTPPFFLSLCLCLSLSLSPCDVVCDVVLCCVSLWSWCVCLVCVCVAARRKTWKKPSRTCVSTCARGVGTHGDVLNEHMEAFLFLNPHTGGRRQFCSPRKVHVEFSLVPREVHQRNRWIVHIFRLRTCREQHVSDSSNHSLYLKRLFSFSNLEANFGGNQQPDGSIGLSRSPLSPPSSTTTTTTTHNTQHTETETHTDRDTETQRHRDTETETKPKFHERLARQTLSMKSLWPSTMVFMFFVTYLYFQTNLYI